jgi:hypothetical protein
MQFWYKQSKQKMKYDEICKLIEQELPQRWKESVIAPVPKNGDELDCSINFIQNFLEHYSLKINSIHR